MPRKPKGSYTRHTTDWFLDRCAIGGVFYNSTVGKMPAIDLFNNAQDGSNLHIYRLWVGNDAGFFYLVTRQSGSLNGTPVAPFPVIASGAALPGIISYADVPNFPSPIPAPYGVGAYIAANNEAGSLDPFEAGGPICVLIPGTSLRVTWGSQAVGSGAALGVTFYYAALADQG
jgi:hypothetical protein